MDHIRYRMRRLWGRLIREDYTQRRWRIEDHLDVAISKKRPVGLDQDDLVFATEMLLQSIHPQAGRRLWKLLHAELPTEALGMLSVWDGCLGQDSVQRYLGQKNLTRAQHYVFYYQYAEIRRLAYSTKPTFRDSLPHGGLEASEEKLLYALWFHWDRMAPTSTNRLEAWQSLAATLVDLDPSGREIYHQLLMDYLKGQELGPAWISDLQESLPALLN